MPIELAILGATGVVGQKALALLQRNPHFEVVELAASRARLGGRFGDLCVWREPLLTMPEKLAATRLCAAEDLQADFIISCLPTSAAGRVEPMLAAKGKKVFSNASTHRMCKGVPLLIPEINSNHLTLLAEQDTPGKIITNPNCAAVGVSLALAPLLPLGGMEHVSVVTLQSVSGAGYPGLPSLSILGNTIPHIEGEEEKIVQETKKILGNPKEPLPFALTVHAHRVPVLYGHMASLHITFSERVRPEDALACYSRWNEKHPALFVIHTQRDRPQSAQDLRHDEMSVHIGKLQQGDNPRVVGLVVLTHNLVRGAAGAAIANMQCYMKCEKT